MRRPGPRSMRSHSLRIVVATSLAACGGYPVVAAIDAGAIDTGGRDAIAGDAGGADARPRDAGNLDAIGIDAGIADARGVDAGSVGVVDAAPSDDTPPPAFT